MTSMPELPTSGRTALWTTTAPAPPTRPRAMERFEALVSEPDVESPAARAEARRVSAERHEVRIQAQTAEGVREAIDRSGSEIRPQVADLRRLYDRKQPESDDAARALEEEKLAAATRAATRTRQAAARLVAMRLATQEKAARAAEEVQADAERLARINADLVAEGSAEAARESLRSRQRHVVDSLVDATGAAAVENPDDTVDLVIGDRALVRGSDVATLSLARAPMADAPGGRRQDATEPAADDTTASTTPPPTLPPSPTRPSRVPDGSSPELPTGDIPSSSAPPSPTSAPPWTTSSSGVQPPRADTPPDDLHPASPPGETDGRSTPTRPVGQASTGTIPAGPGVDPVVADGGVTPSAPMPATETDGPAGSTASAPSTGVGAPPSSGPPSTPGTPPPTVDPAADPASVGDAAIPRVPTQTLEFRWPDASPAPVGGRLGGFVQADRHVLAPALEGLDQVAAALIGAVGTAQTNGTTSSGVPGLPLLVGGSAWTLAVRDGVTAADVASGATLPGVAGAAPGAVPTSGAGLAPTTPEDALASLEARLSATTSALGRRTGVVSAFDDALGAASLRLGQNVSAALGAVGEASSGTVVAALHRANAAMAFAGAAARQAMPTGIPLLVGSSDPAVATAAGVAPLQGPADEVLRMTVTSVAGLTSPSPDGGASPTTGPPPGAASVGPLDPALGTPGVPGGSVTAGASLPVGPGLDASGAPVGPSVTGLSPELPGSAQATSGVATPSPEPLADRTRAVVGDVEFSSASRVLAGVRPGLDVTVHGPGKVTLALTPDPGPALDRVQGLVDAASQVFAAVGHGMTASTAVGGTRGPLAVSAAVPASTGAGALGATAASPQAAAGRAVGSLWSSLTSFASSFTTPTTPTTPTAESPVAGPGVGAVLGAVAAPLAAEVGAAFLDPSGRPLIPGTSVHRGRVELDREAFARDYVKAAVTVEASITSVARSVASTADAASDPRIGALAVRIAAELAPPGEYSIDETATGERLDARRLELQRREGALQSLLEHLEDQSGWLGEQLR